MKFAIRLSKPLSIGCGKKYIIDGVEHARSDVIAVRYRLSIDDIIYEKNGEKAINEKTGAIIATNVENLKTCIHILEVQASWGTQINLESLIRAYKIAIPRLAIFVYADIQDKQDVEEVKQKFSGVWAQTLIDRLLLKDVTETGTAFTVTSLTETFRELNKIQALKNRVSTCCSPAGCAQGMCCLSAVICRELAAKYGEVPEQMSLPTANSEGNDASTSCNCIISKDISSISVKMPKLVTTTHSDKAKTSKASGVKMISEW